MRKNALVIRVYASKRQFDKSRKKPTDVQQIVFLRNNIFSIMYFISVTRISDTLRSGFIQEPLSNIISVIDINKLYRYFLTIFTIFLHFSL